MSKKDRIRPGNPGKQGEVQTIDYESTADTTALVARTGATADVYVDVRTIAGPDEEDDDGIVHICFGDNGVEDATNDDFFLKPEDGWVSMKLLPHDTSVSVKGDAGAGKLQIWYSGE